MEGVANHKMIVATTMDKEVIEAVLSDMEILAAESQLIHSIMEQMKNAMVDSKSETQWEINLNKDEIDLCFDTVFTVYDNIDTCIEVPEPTKDEKDPLTLAKVDIILGKLLDKLNKAKKDVKV